MMNYIKSEFYRITHTKDLYLTAGILTALILLLHIFIFLWGGQYRTTSFSFSNLVANPMLFPIMGAIVAFLLYDGSRKNGNLKNTVAWGISRDKIFLSQCIVSTVISTVIMVLAMSVWIFAAEILLEKRGPVLMQDFMMEAPATYLIATACLISCILFSELFEKILPAILTWISVWFLIPKLLRYIGIRFEHIYDISMWLPDNFFSSHYAHVNTQECITVWDTAGGMIKCLLSGGIGIVIFTLLGVKLLKKKDL